ncbi:hypothetical protein C8Q80DRAFT_1196874 [Daedaleopsis nitida]|nr:hypothetical protein C8Q80DRAFT_1196874 [Daedaleopsis nitida]
MSAARGHTEVHRSTGVPRGRVCYYCCTSRTDQRPTHEHTEHRKPEGRRRDTI